MGEDIRHIIEFVEVLNGELRSAGLITLPTIQLHGRIQVGIANHLVEHRQVRLVDARDGVFAWTHPVVTEEIRKETVACMQMKLVGNHLRDHDLLLTGLATEGRDIAFHHIIM